jgi:hypothetical protein
MLRLLLISVFLQSLPLLAQDSLDICSFNIQFLGHFKNRQNEILASILEDYEIVVVQEMVAAPKAGNYPDGVPYSKDAESAAFVEEMRQKGFSYWLSEEDTGPTKNHTPTTASEWWIVFYKASVVQPDSSRIGGFVSSPLAMNSIYDRVPYAFPFRSIKGKSNFTLVSVHLRPGDSKEDKVFRKNELQSLFKWTSTQKETNRDFYVLGDCNIYDRSEFEEFDGQGIQSLNEDCLSTNTKMYESTSKGEPYDHVFYSNYSVEDIVPSSFRVVDLMNKIIEKGVPAGVTLVPYDHDTFRTNFSDHVPVSFRIVTGRDTDL